MNESDFGDHCTSCGAEEFSLSASRKERRLLAHPKCHEVEEVPRSLKGGGRGRVTKQDGRLECELRAEAIQGGWWGHGDSRKIHCVRRLSHPQQLCLGLAPWDSARERVRGPEIRGSLPAEKAWPEERSRVI
ncbi:hypothetical protein NDU88_000882 [Pleurodeles waltl]|uniref:Uncharacterized protein n=1 Tax=Pleurodeles waltl TaxID=8319 RepID=A0AAV7LXV2_PLEWA|nr:hypothetical protein NDU88_000882 [Pleurodeles waltl]